ncbi:MAG: pimeloyl-CoA dehydrogenase small subunit [Betaproteobacteria bacterium]|nr:pimeloyl-CoA dehydrogenase small subunit [Betaproteobacteria bacterium]
MDLSFNDDQKQLQDALAKFIERDYGFDRRRAHQLAAEGFSREAWTQFADMGLLALPFAEADGGLGGGAAEMLVVMTAIGNGLIVEPYLATVVLAGGAIARAGNAAQRQELLGAIAGGRLIAAVAFEEPGARYDLAQVATTATKNAGGYVISGNKAVVLHGAQADRLVVSARTAGAAGDAKGISLFVIERGAPGMAVRDYRTIDGLRAADIAFDGVRVPAANRLGNGEFEEGGAFAVIDAVADAGAAALCAEAVGVMESLNRQTLEYMKGRQQFGQPIGAFQVLQHRAVDMFIHAEQSKSMAYLAAIKAPVVDRADATSAKERRRAVSAAKVHIGNSGRVIAQEAIQLHGGMGMTNELAASHYAKRLTMIDFVLGDSAHHLARFEAA